MAAKRITVDGVEYRCFVGRTNVKIVPPQGRPVVTNVSVLTGIPWGEIERVRWKDSMGNKAHGDVSVTPKLLEKYIKAHLKG